ncbi:unnamed protein product [Arctogadus glacialis]
MHPLPRGSSGQPGVRPQRAVNGAKRNRAQHPTRTHTKGRDAQRRILGFLRNHYADYNTKQHQAFGLLNLHPYLHTGPANADSNTGATD